MGQHSDLITFQINLFLEYIFTKKWYFKEDTIVSYLFLSMIL